MPDPKVPLCRTRDLVGKLALHDDVAKLLTQNLLPYTIVEDAARKTVGIKTQTEDIVSAEILVVRSCYGLMLNAAAPEQYAQEGDVEWECRMPDGNKACLALQNVQAPRCDVGAGRHFALCQADNICSKRWCTGLGLCDCRASFLWASTKAGPVRCSTPSR